MSSYQKAKRSFLRNLDAAADAAREGNGPAIERLISIAFDLAQAGMEAMEAAPKSGADAVEVIAQELDRHGAPIFNPGEPE